MCHVDNYADWVDLTWVQLETPVPIAFTLDLMSYLMREDWLATSSDYGIDDSHEFDAPAMAAAFKDHMKNYCKLILEMPKGCPLDGIKGIYYRDMLVRTYKYKLIKHFCF